MRPRSIAGAWATIGLIFLGGCAAGNDPVTSTVLLDKAGSTVVDQSFDYPDSGLPEVSSSIVVLEPGAETGWHLHEAPMYGYILEGTLEVTYDQDGVLETRVYREGEAIMEALDTAHNGQNTSNARVSILVVNMGAPDIENTVLLEGYTPGG